MTTANAGHVEIDVDISAIETTLLRAAEAAAKVTLKHFRAGLDVGNKSQSDFDPVTIADRDAEAAIRAVISERFPDHAISGEEQPDREGAGDYAWIIDPIDGTRAFISGVPVWGTLIGVAHRGKVFGGLMSQPFTRERYVGLPGIGWLNHAGQQSPLRASKVTELREAKLFTTTPALFEDGQRTRFDRLEREVMLPRYGCDCYAYCLLAAGHVDLVVEPRLNAYDIAALIPIIRAGGGVVATFEGNDPDKGGDIIAAATPELFEAARKIMAG